MKLSHKKILRTFGIALIIIMICILSLVISAFLPQSRIRANFLESIDFLSWEGLYLSVGDRVPSSLLDNYTDLLILQESDALQKDAINNLWFCPRYFDVDDDDITKLFAPYLTDANELEPYFYGRYWMGFRAPMRLLLTFMDYGDIRRILIFSVFTLTALAACSIGRNTDGKYAFAYLLSVICVKPTVFSQSWTLSCCFIIAPITMLFIPMLYRSKRYILTFFMAVGMLTQFFDFYTAPVITLCYPLLYYLILMQKNEKLKAKETLVFILKISGMWLFGYVFMWIVKLGLTTVFTGQNGFISGLSSLIIRLGFFAEEATAVNPEMLIYQADALCALRAVAKAVFGSKKWLLCFCAAVVLFVILMIIAIRRKKIAVNKPAQSVWGYLLVASIPLIWFCIAKQATYQHAWFQYRPVCVLYFALLCALMSCLRRPASSSRPEIKRPEA